jgi:hypothetical protein
MVEYYYHHGNFLGMFHGFGSFGKFPGMGK